MRQTTKAHRACPPPQILPAKSGYSPKEKNEEEEKVMICKGPNCQSERKERFAQKYSFCAEFREVFKNEIDFFSALWKVVF